jgi:cation diffusion facilitator CzcD-associated flavoprotein CzcO
MEPPRREPVSTHVEAFVLGAGLSGVIMLKKLKDAGVTNVIAVDKASGVGGTWHWNTYPGAACDVDSYAYLPFLHEMGFCPSRKYPSAPEIKGYLEQVKPIKYLNTLKCAL